MLFNLDEYKELQGITSGKSDEKIKLVAEAAEAFLEGITGRSPLDGTDIDELLTGDGTPLLILSRFPVTTLTTVEVSGVALTTAGDDRQVLSERGGILKRLDGGVWPTSPPETIHVVYKIKGVGRDLVMALYDMVEFGTQTKGKQGFTSEKLGNYSYQLADIDQIPGLSLVLMRYKDPARMVR